MKRFLIRLCAAALMVGWLATALAVDDPSEMLPDPGQEHRAEQIGAQLRCLVCQNESIEDSSAPLARDLRRIVRQHVQKGDSNSVIIAWMTQRYGDFIRLKPAFTLQTALLWIMPGLAILIGVGLAVIGFRRKQAPPDALSADERRRLDALGPE